MSLRITQSILYSRALLDVRNGLAGNLRLQEQAASGRRVNRPSDDPAAMLRIVPLKAELRDLEGMLDNAGLAREALDAGAAAVQGGSELLQRVRELAVQGANGTLSAADRTTLAGELTQLLNQMLAVANSRHGTRHLFGGTRTDVAPFTLLEDAGGARVRYGGDQDALQVLVAPDVATAVALPGDRIFQAHGRGATVFAAAGATATGAVPVNAGDSAVGFDRLLVRFAGVTLAAGTTGMAPGNNGTDALGSLSYVYSAGTLSINGGPPTAIVAGNQNFPVGTTGTFVNLSMTGGPVTPATGTITSRATLSIDGGASAVVVSDFTAPQQVRNSFDGTVLNVDVTALARTGDELVTYNGTFDVFTAMIAARDALANADGLTLAQQTARLSGLLAELDAAHDSLLDGLRDLGNRGQQMQLLAQRVSGLQVGTQESLSLAQDADMAETILALNQQDLNYQAALQVSARIVQTSLLDYLR
jgi:flagellar hook-associated protein 3